MVSFAEAQHAIDLKNRELIDNLCSEFYLSLKLREAWGLGLVRVTKSGRIIGTYREFGSSLFQRRFLGNSYEQAMERMNHVKSFM